MVTHEATKRLIEPIVQLDPFCGLMVIRIILESKHVYHYKSHEPYGCEKDEQAEGAT